MRVPPRRSILALIAFAVSGCGGHVPEAVVVPGAPEITSQPGDLSVAEGSPFTLSVSATGDDLSYHWFKNYVPQFGQTGSTFSVSSATSLDNDGYYVVVSNDKGSVQSRTAFVSVSAAN